MLKMRKKLRWARVGVAAVALTLWGVAFSGLLPAAAVLGRTQFIPALLRLGAGAAVLLLLTLLFGRFYCSMLCPLGIIQDLIRWPAARWRRSAGVPELRWLRLAVCGAALGLLACGWAAGFLWLDPYSNFGRIAGNFAWAGAVTLAVIAGAAWWKPRWFCHALCPAGTILGAASKYGVFRLSIDENCVKCGLCVRSCPAGCIDLAARTVDNERCIRCLNCLSRCPKGAIALHRGRTDDLPEFSRRKFLIHGGVFLAGCAAGAVLAKSGAARKIPAAARTPILPPGAGSIDRFAAKCTGCQLCARNCPEQLIVPARRGAPGPVALDLGRGQCRFDCNRCGRVCPTGAIAPLPLAEKQRTRIAAARFNPRHCLVFQEGFSCGKCAAACPVGAIRLRKNGTPRPVDMRRCIGCGACQLVCPATPKALTVAGVDKQILIAKES